MTRYFPELAVEEFGEDHSPGKKIVYSHKRSHQRERTSTRLSVLPTPMKVTFYYRPPVGGYSIEGVFSIIKEALPSNIDQQDFFCTTKWKRLHSFFRARKFQGDINHITGDVHTLALFLNPKRTIVTVHDTGRYERDLKGVKKWIFKLLWLTWPLKSAYAITTVSAFTKDKLVKICGIDPNKINVISNPVNLEAFPYSPRAFNKQQPVVMQIGGGNNKNLHRLIEAVKGTNFKLLLIRQPDEIIKEKLNLANIEYEWHTNLTNAGVYACYLKSDIVFFASEYEGFGVPILEANSIGRPVVTSNIAPMAQVAADAAILVNPLDIFEIRDALLRISSSPDLRASLVTLGQKNIARFAVEEIAARYYKLYQTVSDSP